MSFEVTFEVFETKFYSRLAMQRQYRKLSANIVWTEIYSVIKGGAQAEKSVFGYIQLHDYLSREGNSNSFLTGGEKRTIYFAFLSYEKWKKNVGAYDFMDVVQHVWKNKWDGISYNYHWYGKKHKSMSRGSMEFDYLLVDEV